MIYDKEIILPFLECRIIELQFIYLGGDVDLREFERTTAEDALLPAADGGIPFGPLLALPS